MGLLLGGSIISVFELFDAFIYNSLVRLKLRMIRKPDKRNRGSDEAHPPHREMQHNASYIRDDIYNGVYYSHDTIQKTNLAAF